MKFNYYDNALKEYSKDNILFQLYNQLKYGMIYNRRYMSIQLLKKI